MDKVTKGGIVQWKGGGQPYETVLPAGLRVKPAPKSPTSTEQEYFLDDLSIFAENSFERHDATHYGLRLTENQVRDENWPGEGDGVSAMAGDDYRREDDE